MNKRIAKAKERVKDYAPEIIYATLFATVVGVTIWAAKKQAEMNIAVGQQLAQAISEGKTVLPNPDGSYWIIETQDA